MARSVLAVSLFPLGYFLTFAQTPVSDPQAQELALTSAAASCAGTSDIGVTQLANVSYTAASHVQPGKDSLSLTFWAK